MFNINIDEQEVRELLEQAINARVEELAKEKYFMTYKELANYLNLSKPTIEELLINNGMKYYMVGSTYRFKKSDVDEFMEQLTAHMNIQNNDFKTSQYQKVIGGKAMKLDLLYITLTSLLTILLLAISNMYVAFSVYGMMVTYGFNLTGGLENE
ncbi:mobile element-associated transcriptional regulator, putative [Staphylococcus aureus]|nr:mobile element-associated transcriptional regulator, putative [Staphylococcus aureus]